MNTFTTMVLLAQFALTYSTVLIARQLYAMYEARYLAGTFRPYRGRHRCRGPWAKARAAVHGWRVQVRRHRRHERQMAAGYAFLNRWWASRKAEMYVMEAGWAA